MITLFELCGRDRDIRFGPAVWRNRMMLEHKGLDWTGEAYMFLEKEPYAPSGCMTLPVIRDGDKWVGDSFDIAVYLDQTYPDKSLMGCDIGIAQAKLINNWIVTALLSRMFPMLAVDVVALLTEENAAYFRETREKVLGRTCEEAAKDREAKRPDLQKALAPLHMTLDGQPYLGGSGPAWTDYAVFGPMMWARCVSNFDVLEGDTVLTDWRNRMLDLFGGHARAAKTAYPHD